MTGSRGISVPGEGTDATRVVLGTLLGEEPKTTAARSFEFTVGHDDKVVLKEVMSLGREVEMNRVKIYYGISTNFYVFVVNDKYM